ncbi:MAG: glutathione-dependent formaldehyde dehydrogenase [Candidatus Eremiobacteraeota bacterium]|nr:glutathione-dependent formaldehyde dehydrogenase [Candidatus Eremiobacteraeota bacterium]
MKAVTWHGVKDVRVETVPDPQIVNPHDAIVRVTSTAICGSDLHIYNGYIPLMKPGDILGHEFMGIIEETGPEVRDLKPGDRVVVPFTISCGGCEPCSRELWSLCDNSNPNASVLERLYGYSGGGLYGYSHLYGGYAGGQAEYVRVPFADHGPIRVPESLRDEQVLFLSDIYPTGYQAAENCDIRDGDVIAVWGCGPVGQFAIRSAFMLGASRVIAIDRIPERLRMAQDAGAETVHHDDADVLEAIYEFTGGRGPDACIDAVGMEAHATTPDALADKAKQTLRLEFDRAHVLREAAQAIGKGGRLSIPGVYAGFIDKVPFGALFAKGVTIRMGQTHVPKYLGKLLNTISDGAIDPSFVITHTGTLDDAPRLYEMFTKKEEGFIKSFVRPRALQTTDETAGIERAVRIEAVS